MRFDVFDRPFLLYSRCYCPVGCAEELVLLDCLGTGEVCTFPRNQSEIIHELLLADDARFVRACRCRNFWDKLRRDFSVRHRV